MYTFANTTTIVCHITHDLICNWNIGWNITMNLVQSNSKYAYKDVLSYLTLEKTIPRTQYLHYNDSLYSPGHLQSKYI